MRVLLKVVGIGTLILAASGAAAGEPSAPPATGGGTNAPAVHPQVAIRTSAGEIRVELFPERAPLTVANFFAYVDSGHYAGTIFHRVIPTFMIQGGGYELNLAEKPTRPPVRNEAGNGLSNARGTLAMARTDVVDSATSQFYINVEDNPELDHRDPSEEGFGYCVFGRVVAGMDVVDRIRYAPTMEYGPFENLPRRPVTILEVSRVAEPILPAASAPALGQPEADPAPARGP